MIGSASRGSAVSVHGSFSDHTGAPSAAGIAAAADTLTAEYVAQAREYGATREEVAMCLAVMRQAAQQSYGAS